MRLDFSGERVLAVVAHPDDAELLCAGTLARAKADGAAVGVCVLCQGDKGQPTPPVPNLAEVRAGESARSAALLGAASHALDVPDGTLADTPAERARLTAIYRAFRPTLVLAHDPADYHPDHRAASALAEAASWFCASAGQLPDLPPLAESPALWWMDTVTGAGFAPGFFVDISAFLDLKRRLLGCHESQLRRGADGAFAPLEELMLRQCAARGAQAGVAAAEAFRTHSAWKRVRAW